MHAGERGSPRLSESQMQHCLSGIGGLFCGGDSSTRGQLGLLNRGEEFHTHPL